MPRRAKSPKTGVTVQQEHFCREFVRHGMAHRAYRAAYKVGPRTQESTVNANASKLLHTAEISLRISVLRERAAKASDITLDRLVRELCENREVALMNENSSAATAATLALAKLTGIEPDQTVNLNVDLSSATKDLNANDRKLVREIARRAAERRSGGADKATGPG